jgi:hypothetical protein
MVQWIGTIREDGGNDMTRPGLWPLGSAIILIVALGFLVRLFLQALLVITG